MDIDLSTSTDILDIYCELFRIIKTFYYCPPPLNTT